jgi:hypothetical protein
LARPLWRADGSRSPRRCTPNRPYGLQCGTPHLGEVCSMLCPTTRVLTGSVFACFSIRGYTHPADLPLDLRHLCMCLRAINTICSHPSSFSMRSTRQAEAQASPSCLGTGCGTISTSDHVCMLAWSVPFAVGCPHRAPHCVPLRGVLVPWLPVHPFIARDSRFQGLG